MTLPSDFIENRRLGRKKCPAGQPYATDATKMVLIGREGDSATYINDI